MSYLFLFHILFPQLFFIPCLFLLFLFIYYSFYSLRKIKDKRKINDDKTGETGQIQYQHHVDHLLYMLLQ